MPPCVTLRNRNHAWLLALLPLLHVVVCGLSINQHCVRLLYIYLLMFPVLQCFLSVAFLVETLLMGLHMKHNELDSMVHSLLTAIMIACVVIAAAEVRYRDSFILATSRAMMVFFQGTWFIQVGNILYRGEVQVQGYMPEVHVVRDQCDTLHIVRLSGMAVTYYGSMLPLDVCCAGIPAGQLLPVSILHHAACHKQHKCYAYCYGCLVQVFLLGT